MILILATAVYFFIVGMTYQDMSRDFKLGWWPPIGGLIMAKCWWIILLWGLVNKYCPTTQRWYLKLAESIFDQ